MKPGIQNHDLTLGATHMTSGGRTLRAGEITEEWIGWYIQPLRDERVKGQGGLDGMLITRGRTMELVSIRSRIYNGVSIVEIGGKYCSGPLDCAAFGYAPDTVVELLRPLSAKAKKGARALGYDNRKHKWIDG